MDPLGAGRQRRDDGPGGQRHGDRRRLLDRVASAIREHHRTHVNCRLRCVDRSHTAGIRPPSRRSRVLPCSGSSTRHGLCGRGIHHSERSYPQVAGIARAVDRSAELRMAFPLHQRRRPRFVTGERAAGRGWHVHDGGQPEPWRARLVQSDHGRLGSVDGGQAGTEPQLDAWQHGRQGPGRRRGLRPLRRRAHPCRRRQLPHRQRASSQSDRVARHVGAAPQSVPTG